MDATQVPVPDRARGLATAVGAVVDGAGSPRGLRLAYGVPVLSPANLCGLEIDIGAGNFSCWSEGRVAWPSAAGALGRVGEGG